jgi:hypothetical protein
MATTGLARVRCQPTELAGGVSSMRAKEESSPQAVAIVGGGCWRLVVT